MGRMPLSCRSPGTTTARFSRIKSSGANWPRRAPSFLLGTVTSLLTMSRHAPRRPLPSLGWTGSRKSGASVVSVVKAQIVTEVVRSNRSSWKITAGRGLPAYSGPPATVQTSPRFTVPCTRAGTPSRRSHRRTPGPPVPERCRRQRATAGVPLPRKPGRSRPAPRAGWAAARTLSRDFVGWDDLAIRRVSNFGYM